MMNPAWDEVHEVNKSRAPPKWRSLTEVLQGKLENSLSLSQTSKEWVDEKNISASSL